MNQTLQELYGYVKKDGRRLRGSATRDSSGASKVGDVKELAQRHHEMLNMHVLGMKNVEIAQQLGVTAQSVTQIVNSSLGQEKIQVMRGARDCEAFDVRAELDALLPAAVDVYREILDRNSVASLGLKKKTADTLILDVAGHKAPTKFQGVVAHLDSSMLDMLKERGRAAGIIVSSERSEQPTMSTMSTMTDVCDHAS